MQMAYAWCHPQTAASPAPLKGLKGDPFRCASRLQGLLLSFHSQPPALGFLSIEAKLSQMTGLPLPPALKSPGSS